MLACVGGSDQSCCRVGLSGSVQRSGQRVVSAQRRHRGSRADDRSVSATACAQSQADQRAVHAWKRLLLEQ